jgi:monoamine oxidase
VRSADVRQALAAAVRVIFGADPDELSLLHFLSYCNAGGGFLPLCEIRNGAQQDRIIGGAQPISERLAADLGPDLLLSRPLRAVEQDERGLTLRCDGLELRARRAILALPPAMAARVDYSPALPAPRDQLMQRMPMGATIKVLALYERPFWREQGRSGEVVAGGDPITVCFDNTTIDGQAGLVAFIVGADARRWGARTEAERRAACLAQLERWFGPEARRPHTWAEKDWAAEPWSRGCPIGITAPTVLSEQGEWLRRPIGRLHWAGTETATRWMGFLDGAVQAGERAADEVLAAA